MARLNEIPGPAESVEALKRRFVRQNREIARVNSLQSLRIQSLEAELSHLLKENAALKEQVISLTHDAEKYAAGRAFHKEIHQCKDKLAAKVSELNKLVSELGLIPESFMKKTAHLEAEGETQRSTDPNRRPTTWNDNGDKLPTIMEDKYFPRRTLDPQELAESQDIDSPSIGSPPVAHFDINQSPLARRRHDGFVDTDEAMLPDAEGGDPDPAESASNVNEELQAQEQPVSPAKSASPPVLSGSKRKFSATEDEYTFSPLPATNTSTIDDDFQFTRAVELRTDRPSVVVEIVKEPVVQAKKQPPKKGPPAKRRVLEPKTTNMASSTKRHAKETAQQAEGKAEKPMNNQGGDENSRRAEPAKKISQFQSGNTKKPKRASTALIHEDEPVKPLVSTISEPQESGRIQKKSFNADEPAVTDSMLLPGLGSRPSRRTRGAVSYAEPNLRDKMRRATNELVDAVMIASSRRTSSTVTGTPGREHDHETSTLNNIPEEHESSTDSNIATTTTQALTELPKHMITERKRRTLSASTNDIVRLNSSESGSTSNQTGPIDDSSAILSPSADKSVAVNNTRRRSANPTSQSRRHSSNPAVPDRGKTTLDDEISGYDSEFHDDSLEDSQSSIKDIGTTKAKTARTLSEESSILQAKRSQRVSTRRRSMMV